MSGGLVFRCRGFDTLCLRCAAFLIGLSALSFLGRVSFAANQEIVPQTVQRLIDDAAQAKTDSQTARAYAALHAAVRMAPDYSPAHWQLGQVQVAGEWLSVEEAQRRAEADPRVNKYQERKTALGDTPQAQLALARWCRSNKLTDEAEYHWANVLAVDPTNKEAIRAIGRRWHEGTLKTLGEIKETKKDSVVSKQASREWTSRVATWVRLLSDKNTSPPRYMIDEIRRVHDFAAIPAVEAVTLHDAFTSNTKSPAAERLSLAFLGALNKLPEEAATNSLLRHAVMSPSVEVRVQAISALHYRSMFDYVPTLLENLVAPIQTTYRVVNDPDGSVHYLHAAYREGPFADWSHRTERSIYGPDSMAALGGGRARGPAGGMPWGVAANFLPVSTSLSAPAIVNAGANSRSDAISPDRARSLARQYEREIAEGEQMVARTNQQNAALNDRIIAVLNGATDQKLGNEPRAWWNWWQDYTDYYRDGDRPVYTTEDTSNNYVLPPVQQPTSVECFARGTPVWTKTGKRAIDSLAVGDLVLSQDVKTGEIRYKPVMARTLRPAGPIVQISTGNEKLLATRGHPLWVDGIGWRMAKELGDGAMLHSLAGPGRVDALRPATDAETYNLVVADFNTYFVGTSGILAHDNTPRRPTQAVLPGVLKK
jgi:hypothetical protein